MGTFILNQDSRINSDTVEWNAATLPQHKMDMHKIAHGGEIKYFDSVILYEDELDDNGCSQFSVKIRVMQDYWFALC
jgi:type 2A phosphatase activator TIP41